MKTKSPLLPIFLIVLVDVLALTIMIPLLPFYAEHFGASPLVVGLIAASFAACQLVSGPILGNLSDRYGRRPLLIVSQAGTLFGLLLLAYANSLWLVFVARIIDGVTAGNLSIAQAYVSDHTTPQNRAKAFGIIGIAFGVGFAVGPVITATFSHFALFVPILVAAALSGLSILATYFLLPGDSELPSVKDDAEAPPLPAGRRLGVLEWRTYMEYFSRPGLASLLVQFFLFSLAFGIFTGGFAMFSERRFTWHGRPFHQREVGWVFAYVGILGIILQGGLLGRLVKRFGEWKLVWIGFLLAAIGYAVLGFTYHIGLLLVIAAVSSVGNGMLRPALTSEVTKVVGRQEQGIVLGLMQSLSSIAFVVAPPFAGLLIDHMLLSWWALSGALVAALGFVIALLTPRSAQPAES